MREKPEELRGTTNRSISNGQEQANSAKQAFSSRRQFLLWVGGMAGLSLLGLTWCGGGEGGGDKAKDNNGGGGDGY